MEEKVRERITEIGEKILGFLKTVKECEICDFRFHGYLSSIDGYIDFRVHRHDLEIIFSRHGGGIKMGKVAEHGIYQHSETQNVPVIGGVGPVGWVPSVCFVKFNYIISKEGKKTNRKKIFVFQNPWEVERLSPECVQELDRILIRDIISFLYTHFERWEKRSPDSGSLQHPSTCRLPSDFKL